MTTVNNELERDSEASALQHALAERGYEVRQDSALNQLGLDFAIRESGQTQWPLAVRLTGPGLFHQYLPYQGELPDGDQVAAADCHTATQVWIPDWLENPDNMPARYRELAKPLANLHGLYEALLAERRERGAMNNTSNPFM